MFVLYTNTTFLIQNSIQRRRNKNKNENKNVYENKCEGQNCQIQKSRCDHKSPKSLNKKHIFFPNPLLLLFSLFFFFFFFLCLCLSFSLSLFSLLYSLNSSKLRDPRSLGKETLTLKTPFNQTISLSLSLSLSVQGKAFFFFFFGFSMDLVVDDWFYCVCELRSMNNFLGFVCFSRNFLKRLGIWSYICAYCS